MNNQLTTPEYTALSFLSEHHPIMGYVDPTIAYNLQSRGLVAVTESQVQPDTGWLACSLTKAGQQAKEAHVVEETITEETIIVLEEDNPVPPPPVLAKEPKETMFSCFMGVELALRPDF